MTKISRANFPIIPPCWREDQSGDGFDRTWDKSRVKPHQGQWAGWPAAAGPDGVDPAAHLYPANLNSRLRCGPFDVSQVERMLVRFSRWLQIYDPDDLFFIAVSTDGLDYHGWEGYGVQDWITYNFKINGLASQEEAWILWEFVSDGDDNRAEGVWIDELEIWQYRTPALTCGDLDPGYKGLVLPPYDPTTDLTAPIIRAGDTTALRRLVQADVDWVRLGFIQRNEAIDWRAYDRMVDSLCAAGISVLGLVNDETLVRQDFDNPTQAAAYRREFAEAAASLADHFKGRITYWEVWNEPNYDPSQGQKTPPFIDPERYAPLLRDASRAIKQANPQAQVLFGGLAGASAESHDYFEQVYASLGNSRPFDYFALHPYPNKEYGPDPSVYMYADRPLGYDTIVDKFMQRMSLNNDGHKQIWITEVGWNSAKNSPDRPICHDPVLVTETEQAAYLKPMFDTLRHKVKLWRNPFVPGVEKVIWYQYMDVGITDPCLKGKGLAAHSYAPLRALLAVGNGSDWWFGLYRGDKVTPKLVWCEFISYPLTCAQVFRYRTYLPLVRKH